MMTKEKLKALENATDEQIADQIGVWLNGSRWGKIVDEITFGPQMKGLIVAALALDEMERERDVALANLSKAQGECDVLIAAVAEAHDVQSTLAAKLGEIEKAYHGYMNHHADEPLLTVLSRFFPEKEVKP